jgi:hypothetical protein
MGSPKPETESSRPPDKLNPKGPIAAFSVASTETLLRPIGTTSAIAAWPPSTGVANT